MGDDMNFMFHGDWVIQIACCVRHRKRWGDWAEVWVLWMFLLWVAWVGKGPSGKWLAKIIKIAVERPTFFSSWLMYRVCQIKSDQFLNSFGVQCFLDENWELMEQLVLFTSFHEFSRSHQTKLISSSIMTSTNLSPIDCQRLKGIGLKIIFASFREDFSQHTSTTKS